MVTEKGGWVMLTTRLWFAAHVHVQAAASPKGEAGFDLDKKKSMGLSGTLIDSLRNPTNKLSIQQTLLIGGSRVALGLDARGS
jgi:hypothetical protein